MSRARNHRKALRAADPRAYHAEALRRRTANAVSVARAFRYNPEAIDEFVRAVGRRIALRMTGRGLTT